MGERQASFTRLNKCLNGIREISGDEDAQRCLAVERPKAAYRIGNLCLGGPAYDRAAETLEELFPPGEMVKAACLPIADDDIRLVAQDRRDEQRDLIALILAICVDIHHD